MLCDHAEISGNKRHTFFFNLMAYDLKPKTIEDDVTEVHSHKSKHMRVIVERAWSQALISQLPLSCYVTTDQVFKFPTLHFFHCKNEEINFIFKV